MIAILGTSGMLGSMLSFYCFKHRIPAIRIAREQFDVLKDPIERLDTLLPVDCVVVNCIGAIPQRRYKDDEYVMLNETFPLQLADYCERRRIPFIHISTNCVFSGKRADYTENDTPDAEDVYGMSKWKGEPKNATVFRCSIIGFEKSSANGLLEWFYQNSAESVFGYVDSYWNGLTTYELSRRLVTFVQAGDMRHGLFHFSASNTLSKYQILQYVQEKFKPRTQVFPKEAGGKHYTLRSAV